VGLASGGASVPALADYWFQVPDVSRLKYTIGGGSKVYFRNLNQFHGAVLGCCFNYGLTWRRSRDLPGPHWSPKWARDRVFGVLLESDGAVSCIHGRAMRDVTVRVTSSERTGLLPSNGRS
jgi:hypothetical protein